MRYRTARVGLSLFKKLQPIEVGVAGELREPEVLLVFGDGRRQAILAVLTEVSM